LGLRTQRCASPVCCQQLRNRRPLNAGSPDADKHSGAPEAISLGCPAPYFRCSHAALKKQARAHSLETRAAGAMAMSVQCLIRVQGVKTNSRVSCASTVTLARSPDAPVKRQYNESTEPAWALRKVARSSAVTVCTPPAVLRYVTFGKP